MTRPDNSSGSIVAVRTPLLDERALGEVVSNVRPRGVERALARWRTRLPGLVWNDASLEGNAFTLPDVTTLLDGESVQGYEDAEVQQILDLSRAAEIVQDAARTGPVNVSESLSSQLNAVVGGEDLRAVFDESADRANRLAHPLSRAVAWAGFGAYHQFYGDGNKRTARYVMNAILLSNGFDAILTPVARKTDYNLALRDMYLSGDLTGYALFLASLYDDSH